MKKALLKVINLISKPFAGKGIIHKKLPQLFSLYEKLYAQLQPDEYATVSIKDNALLKVYKKDTHLGMFLLNKDEYEPMQTQEILDSLVEDAIFFDLGANFGYYSVLCANTNSSVHVYSFEPDKANYGVLEQNIALNHLENVVLEQKAVSDKQGSLYFKADSVHRGRSHVVNADEKYDYQVATITLDAYCAEHSIKAIDILKLDVEGSEVAVLKGARTIIENSPSIKIFLEYNPDTFAADSLAEVIESLNLVPTKILDEPKRVVYPYNSRNLQKSLQLARFTTLLYEKIDGANS